MAIGALQNRSHESGGQPNDLTSESLSFDQVYDNNFTFVWRTVRRLGVENMVDDVVQKIFVIVHRKLTGFEQRSSIKTWLYAITRRVVKDHFRSLKRKPVPDPLPDDLADANQTNPLEQASRAEALHILYGFLDQLDEDKREVFVLVELEGMTVPEITQRLNINSNTLYARLRVARHLFEQAVKSQLASDRK